MKLIPRSVLAVLAVVFLILVVTPPRSASAHPMGNFTINHYSALTVGQNRIQILYVLDMAEIPTYQELGTIRSDHSTEMAPAERKAFIARKAAELVAGQSLYLDGKPVALALQGEPALSFPPGAGGLPTLRLELNLEAALGGIQKGTVDYYDENAKGRIGWKEIIARPAGDVTLEKSTVPATDLSDTLHKYPADLLNNPPSATSASFVFNMTATASASSLTDAQVRKQEGIGWGSLGWVRQQTDAISTILTQKELPIGALMAALLIAFGVGAAHALSPGHGKTVVAAYLVGSRGTGLHALFLGLTVTISHTIGVFLLGFVVLYAAGYILPETLYPWLSFISGSLLVVMGMSLFRQRWVVWKNSRSRDLAVPNEHTHVGDSSGQPEVQHEHSHGNGHSHDHSNDHSHSHDDHGHDHRHADDGLIPHKHGMFGRAHTHVPADGQKVTLKSLLVLGITGGIIPCPSALVVLLVAVASQKIALGMLLILSFSLGLAVVLTAIGLVMVYSRNFLNRMRFGGRLSGVFSKLPMVSALGVSCLGVLIALRAFNIG